jgi:hypothetical protein
MAASSSTARFGFSFAAFGSRLASAGARTERKSFAGEAEARNTTSISPAAAAPARNRGRTPPEFLGRRLDDRAALHLAHE